MALIKCPECGKEVSDKAAVCIHCGYPLTDIDKDKPDSNYTPPESKTTESDLNSDSQNKNQEDLNVGSGRNTQNSCEDATYENQPHVGSSDKKPNRLTRIWIAVIVVVVLIIIAIFAVRASTQNAFADLFKPMEKSYSKIINDGYDIDPSEYGITFTKQTDELFGLPGEVEYFAAFDDELGDYSEIYSSFWRSTTQNDLTDKQVNIFLDGMVATFGDYDSKEHKKSRYSSGTSYDWDDAKGYHMSMTVYDDMDSILLFWYSLQLDEEAS